MEVVKKIIGVLAVSLCIISCTAQKKVSDNTLLWKVSGRDISKPSYLFGTIHIICSEDAVISPNLEKAIKEADEVYFEVDLDNMAEMLGLLKKMNMKGDSTWQNLYTAEEYERVKNYFQKKGSQIPFKMLEKYKPMLAVSLMVKESSTCKKMVGMEEVIMGKATAAKKKIQGLESMDFQAGILDKIPYKLQAEQLLQYIDSLQQPGSKDEFAKLVKAYKSQNLDSLEVLMSEDDPLMKNFTDELLYNRNRDWAGKLDKLLPQKSMLIAVGAAHLPGKEGVIELLRKKGYRVEPVENKIN